MIDNINLFVDKDKESIIGDGQVQIDFIWNNVKYKIKGINQSHLFRNVCDWLYDNGYDFPESYHNTIWRKIYDESSKSKIKSSFGKLHNIRNSGKYILNNSNSNYPIKMLELFGVEIVMVKVNKESNWTFVTAAKEVFKRCNNTPMSSNDIWKKIVEYEFDLNSNGKTPWATLSTKLLKYSGSIFETVGSNPIKFKLIKHVPDKVKDCFLDDGFIHISNLKEALESIGVELNTKK